MREEYTTNEKYQEILKLKDMVEKAGIPYFIQKKDDGWQMCYPSKDNPVLSVIEFWSSYGASKDLLELMIVDESLDNIFGSLEAETVFQVFKKYHENLKRGK